jgi:hypothetical protein
MDPEERTVLVSVLLGIGAASLLDLLGRWTYRRMQEQLGSPPQWSPESAFASAARTFGDTWSELHHRQPVDA